MNYDILLRLEYSYDPPAADGRHIVRVIPFASADGQRVVASSIDFDPAPAVQAFGRDFFGNTMVSIAYREVHALLRVSMSARVRVDAPADTLDVSPDLATLHRELAGVLSLAPNSPHHFMSDSPKASLDKAITGYAKESLARALTVRSIVRDLGERIQSDFGYDTESTEVGTSAREAFDLRRGVCQDFSHVMIAGLRGLGIPAAYVSGYLRTVPPPGLDRLVGSDAMHAWVRAWCGNEAGWVGYDPTNRTFTGEDHITVAIGRDYQDVTPIAGVLRTSGTQQTGQKVDVVPVERSR